MSGFKLVKNEKNVYQENWLIFSIGVMSVDITSLSFESV